MFSNSNSTSTLVCVLLLALSVKSVFADHHTKEPVTPSMLPTPSQKIQALPLEDLRIFTTVFSNVRSSYIKEIDDATLLEYAIKGILNELDPHSSYLDANSYDSLQTQTTGEFGGLGIEVGREDNYIRVISPIDDTPAERAGIQAGDLIIKLDGKSIKGVSINEAIETMRGPKGSKVTITILREGVAEPFDVELERDVIKVKSVRSGIRDEHYGYIRVAMFQLNTGKDVKAALVKLKKDSPDLRGVVLDLRNNPGGVLSAAVDMSDAFLDGGLVVYTKGRIEGSDREYHANPGDASNGIPLVVLVNGGSASASEIVAGALQDNNRALILGTRSFGKGSVQSVLPISEDRAVKLTTALYYTPLGRSIQAKGIEPDIIVDRVRVTAVQPRSRISEADLNRHLSNGNGEAERKSKDDDASTDLQNQDSQLYEALILLKGLSLFKKKTEQEAAKQRAAQMQTALKAP